MEDERASTYFRNKMQVDEYLFYRYGLMLTAINLTLIGVLNSKFVLVFTDFFWLVRAITLAKFTLAHGIVDLT